MGYKCSKKDRSGWSKRGSMHMNEAGMARKKYTLTAWLVYWLMNLNPTASVDGFDSQIRVYIYVINICDYLESGRI